MRDGLIAVGVLATVAGAYWALAQTGLVDGMVDAARIKERIVAFGAVGPLVVIAMMIVAIVLTPIPSAPIALAAGAVYGHAWGTLYILVGAEAGALIAFSLARLFGYRFVRRWFGDRVASLPLLGSQWGLTGIVFASRLLPFLSFDLVSYAAGLTPLTAWRFAVATLAGILPASYLLAHFGGELSSGDPRRLAVTGLAFGAVVGLPVLWRVIAGRRARDGDGSRAGRPASPPRASRDH